MTSSSRAIHQIGEILRVEVEKVAHGGHFIARHQGAVFFIRYAIPGELVDIQIRSVEKSFYTADVVAVIEPSPHRRPAPCQHFGAGLCGGCDFMHIDDLHQRELKSQVIAEQFSRIAKMEIQVEVEEISNPLHWRTRYAAATNDMAAAGFKKHSSNEIVEINTCPILLSEIDFPTLPVSSIQKTQRVEVALSTTGERSIAVGNLRTSREQARQPLKLIEGAPSMRYDVNGVPYKVSQSSFWQSNIAAPETLVDAVLAYAEPKKGEHFLDLYGGVGLFAGALVQPLGAGGRIDIVEASASACSDATQNFADTVNVSIHQGDVAKLIKKFKRADVVILDPPRTGAGKAVLTQATALSARALVYVACDPAALARDALYLSELGYRLSAIRAFDIFPQTHHIECIALFIPNKVS